MISDIKIGILYTYKTYKMSTIDNEINNLNNRVNILKATLMQEKLRNYTKIN